MLTLAADGLSYAEIARTLIVSRATVRKHMENVRCRLGVHSMRAAAALALPHAEAVGAARRPRVPAEPR